jgi:hypothetical protein
MPPCPPEKITPTGAPATITLTVPERGGWGSARQPGHPASRDLPYRPVPASGSRRRRGAALPERAKYVPKAKGPSLCEMMTVTSSAREISSRSRGCRETGGPAGCGFGWRVRAARTALTLQRHLLSLSGNGRGYPGRPVASSKAIIECRSVAGPRRDETGGMAGREDHGTRVCAGHGDAPPIRATSAVSPPDRLRRNDDDDR